MSETEIVVQLPAFTSLLLTGISILAIVVYAYLVALKCFIGAAPLIVRLLAYSFVLVALSLTVGLVVGAQSTQLGLIQRLRDIETEGGLGTVGHTVLANATTADGAFFAWPTLFAILLALGYPTFIHRWRRPSSPR